MSQMTHLWQPAPAFTTTPQGGAAHAHYTRDPQVNTKALTTVVFVIVALLALVIFVGLARNTLDTTGVAVTLASILSGIVAGILLRERGRGS